MSAVLITNAWPEALPLPFTDYTANSRTTTLVSDLTSGRIQRRAQSRKTYGRVSATWMFGTTQKRIFESYYETTLGCGVACFSLDLRLAKNSELTTWMVRFGDGGYDIVYLEGIWQVTAALELIIPALLTDAVVDPEAGFDELLVRTAESGGEESVLDSDGQLFMVTV